MKGVVALLQGFFITLVDPEGFVRTSIALLHKEGQER
jgi:hypothetical protein